MLYVAGGNLLPILVAVLIGFVTGLWIWKFARAAEPRSPVLTDEPEMRRPYVDGRAPAPLMAAPAPTPLSPRFTGPGPRAEPEVLARRAAPPPAELGDDIGDNDVASGAAAAVEDVADQFLGIDAHPAPAGSIGGTTSGGDDLQVMKGVGPKLASLLRGEGITRYDQIASLTADDLARLDAHLGAFKGRLQRDRIVDQAVYLAAGDRGGYEREFGKL